ncbi:hypothetical protein [Methanocella sp. MCL-LM]|uniref:hypothetical protein n=1 Tax=Methanocella sp. MCL-LM TaxID=3412035 RepID=UPI003C72DFE7
MNDPEIDVPAILSNIDRVREILVRAEPELQSNHHNLVRVSVIEELISQALGYANTMR